MHCVYVPKLSYSFVCWWTSRLLPCPGYYKQCCDEHWGTCISFNSGFLSVDAQQIAALLHCWWENPVHLLIIFSSSTNKIHKIFYSSLSICFWLKTIRTCILLLLDHWNYSYQVHLFFLTFKCIKYLWLLMLLDLISLCNVDKSWFRNVPWHLLTLFLILHWPCLFNLLSKYFFLRLSLKQPMSVPPKKLISPLLFSLCTFSMKILHQSATLELPSLNW